LDRCNRVLVCVSDAYCVSTDKLELQLSQRKDPAYERALIIPAIVAETLTQPIPAELRGLTCLDLTDTSRVDAECKSIADLIRRQPTERPFASVAEILALQRLLNADPAGAANALKEEVRNVFAFLFEKELKRPAPSDAK